MADVKSRHPSYDQFVADWESARDTYKGERAVKARDNGQRYLPPTAGMRIDGMKQREQGWENYQSYLKRALLVPFMQDAVDLLLGMLWHRPPTMELGPLEGVFGDNKPATPNGQSLLQLWRRVHVQQLVTGRLGLLVDLPKRDQIIPEPYVELYEAEQIINWDEGASDLPRNALNMVVLNESAPVRKVLQWNYVDIYRLLFLGDLALNEPSGPYTSTVIRSDQEGGLDVTPERLLDGIQPMVHEQPLGELPFVFIGSKQLGARIDDPPLIGLVNSILALFRMDADYRQYLHMQGQDTLVTIGAEEGEVQSMGAGAHIPLSNPKADAKMIGVSGAGLAEMRQALENDRAMAAKKSGELLSDNSKSRESGEALAHRVGTRSASLTQIAHTAAEGLQTALRMTARWMGAGDAAVETIVLTPNLEFSERVVDTKSIKELVEIFLLGGPVTMEQIYAYGVSQGLTDVSWDDFQKAKKTEQDQLSAILPEGPSADAAEEAAQLAADQAEAATENGNRNDE